MNVTALLLAQTALTLDSPMIWGIGLGAAGLALRLAPQAAWQKFGIVAGLVGIALMGYAQPLFGNTLVQVLFWLMAALAIVASGAAVTSRSAVYAAIWFAVSLLGTAGLFLLQGAQFLGIATVVVYAGAIVVTFLFVLMLAQPEGHSPYDRISWAGFAIPIATIGVALLIGTLISLFPDFESLPSFDPEAIPKEILHEEHVARLGGELFARHLVSVEVVGTVLLVALVGAIAIVIQGNPRRTAGIQQRGEQEGASDR